ncbi:MAG: hypothetical protein ACO3CE_05775 [Pelagibacteraceae bacterium]
MTGQYNSVKGGASINFKPIKATSEAHNKREMDMPHIHKDKIVNNEEWILASVHDKRKEIESYCKKQSGRKLQKNAEAIREAVVNIKPHHTINDLKKLSKGLQEQFGIECFQIFIHRDEGLTRKGETNLNHHAHIVCRWQDMNTGKTFKFNPHDLSKMQDFVAESLGMERGTRRENSNVERLEATEYKVREEEKYLQKIKLEVQELEQKKNKLFTTNNELRERKQQHTKRIEHLIQRLAKSEDLASIQKEYTEGEIIIGNYSLTQGIHKLNEEIRELEEQFKSIF